MKLIQCEYHGYLYKTCVYTFRLYDAVLLNKRSNGTASLGGVTDALSKVPGTGDFIKEAQRLQADSDNQAAYNSRASVNTQQTFEAPPGSVGGPPSANIPGMNMDPQQLIKRIYPILIFQYVNVPRA